MLLFFGAGYGSRFSFSFPFGKENSGAARSSPRQRRSSAPHLDWFVSLHQTKSKGPPDRWSFAFGAGYGSRTRLHGLGSRCITDIRILHCVGIIAKAGRNFNTYFVDGQKQTKDFPISISLSSPYKMYCSYPARYGVS